MKTAGKLGDYLIALLCQWKINAFSYSSQGSVYVADLIKDAEAEIRQDYEGGLLRFL